MIKAGKVIRCESENHVPIVTVSKDPRTPDDPSKASGNRLQIPGVRAPGDRSHKFPEWLQPFKEGLSAEPSLLPLPLTQSRGGTTCS